MNQYYHETTNKYLKSRIYFEEGDIVGVPLVILRCLMSNSGF
jgi:hypothetical protein